MAAQVAASAQLGVTPPISSALPTEEELRLNEALIAELRSQDNFETAEDTEKRKRVLAHMQRVTEEFVRHVAKVKGLAPSVIDSAGGKVSTFGSYRLGVYGPGILLRLLVSLLTIQDPILIHLLWRQSM
jgi:poly(A) polymerase